MYYVTCDPRLLFTCDPTGQMVKWLCKMLYNIKVVYRAQNVIIPPKKQYTGYVIWYIIFYDKNCYINQ